MKSIASPVSLAERRSPLAGDGLGGAEHRVDRDAQGAEGDVAARRIDEPAADTHHDGEHHIDLHVTSHATGKRHILHDVLDLLGLLLIGVLAWALWPASLGGSTHIIVVQGHSMEPVFHLGDAIVVKENDDPQVGDIIVYRVPKGEPGAGSMVVHRIVAFRSDGTIQTRGDNREVPDPFKIGQEDILGTPAWTLPHVGRMIGLASNPLVVGVCIGLIAMLMLLPGKEEKDEEDGSSELQDAAASGPPEPSKVEGQRRKGRRLASQRMAAFAAVAPDEPSDDTSVASGDDVRPDDAPADGPGISPVVAARVRSLREPQQLSIGDLDERQFDDLLSSLGPDA